MRMEKILYTNHPLRCNICGPSNVGRSFFLTKLILYINKEYCKIYNYSPSLQQNINQKLNNGFSNYIPFHIIPNILIEEDLEIVNYEIVSDKYFQKSDTEVETYEIIGELKYPQDYEDGGIIILDDSIERKRTILVFKRCLKKLYIMIYLFL